MRNVMQKQEDLKGLSQQQLVKEMQMPSGQFEQFLVLTELGRRKRMTDDQARREAADDTNTVAQEVVNAAGVPQGGIAQLASAMNAKTDNTQNTGVKQMAEGGVVKMQEAGQPTDALQRLNEEAVAELKRLYPEVYEQYKDKPRELLYIARQMVKVAEDPELTGLEELEKPRTNFEKFKDFTGYSQLKANKNMKKIEEGSKEREIADQIATQKALTRYFDGGDTRIPTVFDNPIFAEGAPSIPLTGNYQFPRTLSQVGLTPSAIKSPSMGSDISSSLSNAPDTAPEVTLGSLPSPEINLATSPNMPPFTSMLPSLSTGDVGVGGKVKKDITRSLLAGENPFETGVPLELQADAATDLNRRAIDFVNSDTYTPPEMIYSGGIRDILKREEATPEEIQAASDRLAREATADEAAKTGTYLTDLTENNKKGLGPDAAAALREGALRTLQDRTQPTLVEGVNIPEREPYGINAISLPFTDKNLSEFMVDSGASALKGVGSLFEAGKDLPIGEAVTQVGGDIKDIISEGIQADKVVRGKISDYLFGEDVPKEGEGSLTAAESAASKANETAEAKTDPIQDAVNKIIENQNKQAGASNLSMSKYLEGLEKDREFDQAMALVEAGGQLMQPSATIGEGVGKSLKAFTKSRRAGQKEYNKSKLAIIGLGAKIDAAKASASARAGIAGARLQTATLADERDQLQSRLDMAMLPFMGSDNPPDAKSSIVIKDLQRKIADLNNQIRTASGLATLASVGADSGNIFGSYDVTKAG